MRFKERVGTGGRKAGSRKRIFIKKKNGDVEDAEIKNMASRRGGEGEKSRDVDREVDDSALKKCQ